MGFRPKSVPAALLFLGLVALAGVAPAARGAETEAQLEARLKRESDPVRKGKLEIRLSRFKLYQAADAFDKGNIEEANKLLEEYLKRVKGAWSTLKSSGRQAHKKSAGFKELDIALREDARYLDDLKHRVSYMVRDPVEKAAQEVEGLRNDVLKALFPAEPPRKPSKAIVRRAAPDFLMRKI
jgi:hypothetical protein